MFRENDFEAPNSFNEEQDDVVHVGVENTDTSELIEETEEKIDQSEGDERTRLEAALEQLKKMRG